MNPKLNNYFGNENPGHLILMYNMYKYKETEYYRKLNFQTQITRFESNDSVSSTMAVQFVT